MFTGRSEYLSDPVLLAMYAQALRAGDNTPTLAAQQAQQYVAYQEAFAKNFQPWPPAPSVSVAEPPEPARISHPKRIDEMSLADFRRGCAACWNMFRID